MSGLEFFPPSGTLPRLTRFEILEPIGRGNTGTIYRARAKVQVGALPPGQEVALKLLHPHLIEREEARKAFLREARAGMKIRHPNLVRVWAAEEVRTPQGRNLYLVLDLIHGRTLRERIDEEGLASEPTLRILGQQIAGALQALHEAGVMHLDVKPENIMWDEERAVLMDLGFARRNPEASSFGSVAAILESGGSDALFVGTPAYAAPEVLGGRKPTAAADLFALGVTLYECATGVRPFGDERQFGLFEARRTAVVRRPSTYQPRLSAFFDALILDLLAERPEDRLASAAVLVERFQRGERGSWWRQREHAPVPLPIPVADAMPFAGRHEEHDRLESAFAEARRDRTPRVVVLSGIAAVGKTRLAIELGRRWRLRSEAPPFLYGRCQQLGRGSALRAVRDAFARSLGLTPQEGSSPSVERRLRNGLPPGAAEILIGILRGKPYRREARQSAFKAWLRVLGAEGPLILFFDDLQATGSQLWTFVEEMLQLEGVPALVLLAHRPQLEPEAAQAKRELLRHSSATELELAPLDKEEQRQILQRAFLPGGLPAGLEEDLLTVSRGLPGVLTDVLRYLVQRGELRGEPGRLQAQQAVVHVPLTADQAEILRAEIAEMPDEQRKLLLWAAMLQPPLDVDLVAEVAQVPQARAARQLDRLQQAGWLEIAEGGYRWSRPRLREAAYRYVSPKGQRRRHARVFEVLSQTQLEVPEWEAARAFHAHRAGNHLDAVRLGLPLVERHLTTSSIDRAEQALEIVGKHAEALGWDRLSPAVRVRLLVASARIAGWRGDREQEADDLKLAGEYAVAADDDRLAARVHLGLALHARSMGFPGAARVHVQRARDLLQTWRDAEAVEP